MVLRWHWVVWMGLACSLAAGPLLAQPTAPAPSTEPGTAGSAGAAAAAAPAPAEAPVTRPVPRSGLAVAYPAGARGSGRVVLELSVDATGRVSEVRAVVGGPPFTDAALAAARGWSFDPARRGTEPVAVRIRVEVNFTPPAPETPDSATPGAGPGAPPAARRPPEPPIEIMVLGERPEPARTSLGRAEVRELPGTFGDPFRAIEIMPGVTPLLTGVPFFFVRGAPPGNVGYFLDGVRVPLLYHVALGPSVIHPGLVERVDLYPGGYPARFGRFAGGIVAAETEPPRAELHGEANLRIFDAGLMVEGPFADGRGVALAAGRYSYTAAILSLVAPDVTLAYWDYQGRVSYELSPGLRVGAFAFGAYDLFRQTGDDQSLGTQFHRVDLRADLTPDRATRARVAVTLGLDRSGQSQDGADDDEFVAEDKLLGVRAELQHEIARSALLRTGADVMLDRYGLTFDDEEAAALLFSRTDVATGAHADLVWDAGAGVTLTPGLRFDVYASRGVTQLALEPRASAVFRLSERVRIQHAAGIAHQAPAFTIPVPGIQISDLEDGLQSSLQHSAGVVVEPGDAWELGLTLFQNAFFDMTDFLGAARLHDGDGNDVMERIDDRSLGRTYGLELVAKRPLTRRLAGYFAYTLSRSTRSAGTRYAVAAFDRTHVLHAALGYDLGYHFRAGARLSAYSGVPAEREFDNEFGPSTGAEPPEGRRAPTFERVDVRLEKRWLIDQHGRYWAFVIELLNATLSKEVIDYQCTSSTCSGETIGPVTIPSIGGEVFF